jgi:K+-transporting ATPase ATPase C chain
MTWRLMKPAVLVTVGLWLLLGLAYPLALTGVSQIFFRYQANGSLLKQGSVVIGAANVGQNFWGQKDYFWGRPSATVSLTTGKPDPYNAENSSPSNLGPTNAALLQQIKTSVHQLLAASPGLKTSQIPLSLVESSGSGLDPDITLGSALIQVPRVARNTGLSQPYLRALVKLATQTSQWGLFGERQVNVLDLNLLVYKSLHKES